MAKRLSQMTWDDVQKEMSIAGNPDKITQAGKEIMGIVEKAADRRLEEKTGQKIL